MKLIIFIVYDKKVLVKLCFKNKISTFAKR